MNDDAPDIHAASSTGEASLQPDGGREAAPGKKKRTRVKAKAAAAAAALEERIGHKFADPALLTTAFTHVSAAQIKFCQSEVD